MNQVESKHTPISDDYISLRVIPQCTNTFYNEFIQHANATSTITYVVGSGPLSIPYPPETFTNTWSTGCGNITASLIDYDASLARLYSDEIVVETSDESQIGQTSDLVYECSLDWDGI